MNNKNTTMVEIEITLNTGFNMFLNPNTTVLFFEKSEDKPKRKYTKRKEK
jgi:hypothetical protein